jgi:tRNA(Ile)-lysidine synthase
LHEFLKEYGFSWRICTDIAPNLTQTHVQYYYAAGKTLLLDRLKVSVYEEVTRNFAEENEVYPTISCQYVDEMPDNLSSSDKNTAWLSIPKLKGKLSLRKWQKADVFWPWGMEGRKLLSDYFTDLKLSPEERTSQWLLMCDEEIVWVVNRRIDRRFAAISGEKEIIKVQIIE